MEQSLEGILRHDNAGWSTYVRVGGKFVKYWVWDRLAELPEGAYVRILVEVIDPDPDPDRESE